MKALKALAIAAMATSMVACNNASESEAETTSAQEVAQTEAAAVYAVAPESAQINWRGFKTNVDWGHDGTIQITEGEFQVENGELVGGSFVIDMNTIHATDYEKDSEDYGKLIGHLSSDDFFSVGTYPTAKFEITDVMANTDGETSHIVKGNLTMKDKTNNITIPANVEVVDGMVSFDTPQFSIDRKKWGVMYASTGVEGVTKDQLIDDYILLSVDLTAKN
ncbi:YceI family protein [Phaeocystidibacter luteus]|uniref:YceI family protein n=1 Tax=Phaeocystidibacter luteus TaxID=911197 RepID=A0A6N6RMJ7_9FLAO|nr:YceI family protein [Phaeocystidibacter luteus]KAB2814789.1 YceI family protein [Phaeocystidibacter luteus]